MGYTSCVASTDLRIGRPRSTCMPSSVRPRARSASRTRSARSWRRWLGERRCVVLLPVQLLGHRNDVPRLLAAADFFLLVSKREGLSFALLEAMAHGLPAIVADVCENVEAVGDSGLAVPYGDEAALAAALVRLAGDEAGRAILGNRA